MSEKSEYRRGKRYTKQIINKYRSVKVQDGYLVGYTKTGSKHKIFPKGDMNHKKGFYGGMSEALREKLKKNPVRKVIRTGNPFFKW